LKPGRHLNLLKKTLGLSIALLLLLSAPAAAAQSTTVHAVLFYSPTCPHCHKVINEDLPPLIEKYGGQLNILAINVGVPEGQALYQAAVEYYQIPQERLGVPCLIVGDTVLVGSLEIPEQFPAIIEAGLASGGIDWPAFPGLKAAIPAESNPQAAAESESDHEDSLASDETAPEDRLPLAGKRTMLDNFKQDPAGNSISVIVLLGMLASVTGIGYRLFSQKAGAAHSWPGWTIPTLSILGLVVAGYLSFVEITQTEAVCGPVGDCNAVQQSPYAVLFGVLPVGILGLAGYVALIVSWGVQYYGPQSLRRSAALLTFGMAAGGVIFSLYLTFLEPFVIGATCAWCAPGASHPPSSSP